MEFDKELLEKTIPELEHFGVKGMRWGVRRKNPSGKSGSTKEPGRVKQEIASFKREVSSRKDLKNLSKFSESQIKSKTERLRYENDLKRMAKRKEYIKRSTLSNKEIKSRVERLRLEDALQQQIKSANKGNVDLANKLINESAKLALSAFTGSTGSEVADTIITESLKYAKSNKVIEQSVNGEYNMPSNLEKLLAVADPDLEHFGVKGMKWGKRKAASYMDKVNKHEAKTKARRSMTYMEKVRAHESKTKADWAKVRDIKAREKAQGKAVAKKYMNSVNKHEAKTKARRVAKAEKRLTKKDNKWEKNIEKKKGTILTKSYNSSITLQNAMLDGLNARYPKVNKKYFKEYNDNMIAILNSTLAANPKTTSPSGKKMARMIIEENADKSTDMTAKLKVVKS